MSNSLSSRDTEITLADVIAALPTAGLSADGNRRLHRHCTP